jgi:hypothetical protein
MEASVAMYFVRKAGTPVRILSTRHGVVDFRDLTLKRAEQLFHDGFSNIELTTQGRIKYLGEKPEDNHSLATVKEIAGAIDQAQSITEVERLYQLRADSVTVQKAYEQKKKQLAAS